MTFASLCICEMVILCLYRFYLVVVVCGGYLLSSGILCALAVTRSQVCQIKAVGLFYKHLIKWSSFAMISEYLIRTNTWPLNNIKNINVYTNQSD